MAVTLGVVNLDGVAVAFVIAIGLEDSLRLREELGLRI